MADGIVGDVCTVWADGQDAMWSAHILARLIDLRPDVYGGWSVSDFGDAMRASGVSPVKIGRRIDGRPQCRYGVRIDVIRTRTRKQEAAVYFVERDGFVKIGTTVNLPARLHTLGRGNSAIPGMTVGPVRLLATMPGGLDVETSVHRMFQALRFDGEWFLGDEPLAGFIAAVARAGWRPAP